MNLEKHKTGVGAFVLAAIALLVTGIIALGGGKYLSNDTEYILYFNSSVTGLSIGAPVMLRGVTVGSVTRITLMTTTNKDNVTTPINIRIDANSLMLTTGKPLSDENTEQEVVREMISKGLRAQLQTASLLTGQARIQLDFHPEVEARFQSPNPLLEIPTMNSTIDNLQGTLRKVPMEEIFSSLQHILLKIDDLMISGQIERTLQSMENAFTSMNVVLTGFASLQTQLTQILDDVSRGTKQVPQAVTELRQVLKDLSGAANEIHTVAKTAKGMVEPNSPLATQLNNLIRDGAAAARSLRSFADTLDRNPEAVLRGRQGVY